MQQTTFPKHVYFSGLDGLRLFAAFAVVVHHIELIKGDVFGTQLWRTTFFKQLGPISVTFFFTLSGFLITYFLFKEKGKTKTIDLKTFFIKRSVRLIPVYYLIIILSLFVFPHFNIFKQPIFSERLYDDFIVKVIFYIILLPQMPHILFPNAPIPYAVQSWAIGVENIFYLFWPWFLKTKVKFITIFIVTLFVFTGIPTFLTVFIKVFPHPINNAFTSLIFRFFDTMRFSCMAIGGLFGMILFLNKAKILHFLGKRIIHWIILIIIGVLGLKGIHFKLFDHEIYSFLFSCLILNFVLDSKSFSNKFFSLPLIEYLGKRSYGIYMFHMIAIQIALISVKNEMEFKQFGFFENILIYSITFGIAIALAAFSFHYFEKPIASAIIFRLENHNSPRI